MPSHDYRRKLQKLLAPLDIRIYEDNDDKNNIQSWDIQVHNPELYRRILSYGPRCRLAFGESYMDGWWDAEPLDEFFAKLTKDKPKVSFDFSVAIPYLQRSFMQFFSQFSSLIGNMQDRISSRRVAEQHYDLGNEFYKTMLDKEFMQYTCAYFKDTDDLDEAQKKKLELICEKLHLPEKGERLERVLELGSGFGGLAKFATTNYNCEFSCYNISKEQVRFARDLNLGLPVKIHEAGYEDSFKLEVPESFDKVVSVGLCEHIRPKNYQTFMAIADYFLKPEALFLVHTIGRHVSAKQREADPWMTKYPFPESHLPSASQIAKASEGFFRLEDVHNFGQYYDKTLMAWFKNFDRNWPEFIKGNNEFYETIKIFFGRFNQRFNTAEEYFNRFYRMWKYYLLSSSGAFRSGSIDLFQFVFRKGNSSKIYEPVR